MFDRSFLDNLTRHARACAAETGDDELLTLAEELEAATLTGLPSRVAALGVIARLLECHSGGEEGVGCTGF